MAKAKKSAPLQLPLTNNGAVWAKIRPIAAGRLTMEETQVVVAAASVACDRGYNVLRAITKREPGFTRDDEPGSVADLFFYIYHRQPDACLQIMAVVRKWHSGLTDIQKALIGESARARKEDRPERSAKRIADTMAPPTDPMKSIDGEAVKRQRTKLRVAEQEFANARRSSAGDQKSVFRSPTK
jgi:hypothetical protein